MTQKNLINTLAENVLVDTLKQFDKENRYGVDPLTIIMVIGIIISLVRVVQECRKDKSKLMTQSEKNEYISTEIKSFSFNHGFLTRMRIRNVIKKHLTKDQYKKYGDALMKSLLNAGKKITEEQVTALLEYKNV